MQMSRFQSALFALSDCTFNFPVKWVSWEITQVDLTSDQSLIRLQQSLLLGKDSWWEEVAGRLPGCNQVGCLCNTDLVHVDSQQLATLGRAVQEINSLCRNFFRSGSNQTARAKCIYGRLAHCFPSDNIGRPGLGVPNLKLAKWLAEESRSWPWLEIHIDAEVEAFFRASVSVIVGDRWKCCF